jgi:DNA-directed RNA polymerase specialized sigma24 family protein
LSAAFEAYLRSEDDDALDSTLGELMESDVRPVVRRVVTSRLAGRWDDVDDVCSEAGLELLLHLRRVRSAPRDAPIRDLPAYVSAIAVNACNRYFRRRRPGRARMKKQIRILLADDPVFRLRSSPQGSSWGGLAAAPPGVEAADLSALATTIEPDRDLGALLRSIFEAAGRDIEIDDLADLVARIWGIPDEAAPVPDGALDLLAAESRDPEVAIDDRRFMLRLWQEIRLLPREQRVSLLLFLRDAVGNSVLFLLPVAGVASFAQLAATLEIPEAELLRLWNELPADDLSIASLLGCARQRVINLRTAARKRLGNRLRRWRQ